jgi:hypothetical protein
MTGVLPPCGVGAFISVSRLAGGQITPSERERRALKFSAGWGLFFAASDPGCGAAADPGGGDEGAQFAGAMSGAGGGVCPATGVKATAKTISVAAAGSTCFRVSFFSDVI